MFSGRGTDAAMVSASRAASAMALWRGSVASKRGKVEHDFVEISRAPLPAGLKGFAALTRCFAVQKSGEITCFPFGGRRGPIEFVVDRICSVVQQASCGLHSGLGINHAPRRERELRT